MGDKDYEMLLEMSDFNLSRTSTTRPTTRPTTCPTTRPSTRPTTRQSTTRLFTTRHLDKPAQNYLQLCSIEFVHLGIELELNYQSTFAPLLTSAVHPFHVWF